MLDLSIDYINSALVLADWYRLRESLAATWRKHHELLTREQGRPAIPGSVYPFNTFAEYFRDPCDFFLRGNLRYDTKKVWNSSYNMGPAVKKHEFNSLHNTSPAFAPAAVSMAFLWADFFGRLAADDTRALIALLPGVSANPLASGLIYFAIVSTEFYETYSHEPILRDIATSLEKIPENSPTTGLAVEPKAMGSALLETLEATFTLHDKVTNIITASVL